jgi:energy-coupling factor transporter ATP-binding protein EcfA2
MLTRLRVKGFKNLRDVDLALGPFTCIAGPNGVGKSNLFDAIMLLAELARRPILEAMLSVRGTNGRVSELGRLFASRTGSQVPSIEFIADIIVGVEVRDDFERSASPSATFLEYSLKLSFDPSRAGGDKDPVYIEHEGLKAKSSSDAMKWLPFKPDTAWVAKHVKGPGNRSTPFIQTEQIGSDPGATIKLFGERTKKGGRPSSVPAHKSPQTVLCGVNAVTHPTVLAARNEMRSWRLLQLEPSALRRPDELHGDEHVSAIGEHLPAALARIGDHAEITRRLSDLLPGVQAVEVVSDPVRQTRTLAVKLRDQQSYSASSLSLVCLEEPENGIHPERIPAMLALVRALADDEDDHPGSRNEADSLRQVLINTHSPLVVGLLPDDALLVAESLRQRGQEFVNFKPMPRTWRTLGNEMKAGDQVTRGHLLAYLGPSSSLLAAGSGGRRVVVADHLTPDLFSAR